MTFARLRGILHGTAGAPMRGSTEERGRGPTGSALTAVTTTNGRGSFSRGDDGRGDRLTHHEWGRRRLRVARGAVPAAALAVCTANARQPRGRAGSVAGRLHPGLPGDRAMRRPGTIRVVAVQHPRQP